MVQKNIFLKACTMEGVQNFEQKSSGRLDRGAAWNSLCSGIFVTGHVSSNTAIMQVTYI